MSDSVKLSLGIFTEGVVELEPMTGRMVVRLPQLDGSNLFLDVQEELAKYLGEEVRFIVTPIRAVNELAKMVEAGEVALDEIPLLKN
jgi:hypothetical protein